MRRDLRSSAVNDQVAPWGYTRVMMNNRILTICAAVSAVVAAEAAGTLLASAQSYPPQGGVYSPTPQPYPPYPTDYRAAPPRPLDYDVLEDDEGPRGLSPPGASPSPYDPRYSRRPVYPDDRPIASPDDPRYGHAPGMAPVYSGPVMSPYDPRYGRPAGAPPTNYSGPVMSPDDPRYGRPMPPPGG